MTTKIHKRCNNCRKVKLVKATHNYANCCGGRAAFTALSDEEVVERLAQRERTLRFIEELAA